MYEVIREWYLSEKAILLTVGMQFTADDLEADTIAELLSGAVIVSLDDLTSEPGAEPEVDDLPFPAAETSEDAS